MIEGVAPGIAFVAHPVLKNTDGGRAAFAAAHFQAPAELGSMLKGNFLREESADFQIGIYALLETPEDFEHQSLAVHDRRIALVLARDRRLELRLHRTAQFTE